MATADVPGNGRKGKVTKQLQKSIKVNNAIIKFLQKRKKFTEELKDLLSKLGAEFQLKPAAGFITVKKVDPKFIKNWHQRCEDTVNAFCRGFHHQRFPVKECFRNSVVKDLPFLQKNVSSFGAACWLDTNKKNLIVVSPEAEQNNVTEFIQKKIDKVEKECYERETPIRDLVEKNTLPGFDETLKSGYCKNSTDENNARPPNAVLTKSDEVSGIPTHDFLHNVQEENENTEKVVEILSEYLGYLKHIQFLDTLKEEQPTIKVTVNEARNQICFVGSNEATTAAKQACDKIISALVVMIMKVPVETMKFLTQEAGLEFFKKRLSSQGIISFVSVETEFSSGVKVVAKSVEVYEKVKECLCRNICGAVIHLPAKNEHVFLTKKWQELSEAMNSEELLDYNKNFENGTKRDGGRATHLAHTLRLHGATLLVEKYKTIVRDYIQSQNIVRQRDLRIPTGVVRFIVEKVPAEVEKIETDLREYHVKLKLDSNHRFVLWGTKEGIVESKLRVKRLNAEITTRCKDYSKVGVDKLLSNENGQRNLKGIEVGHNVVIQVSKVSLRDKKESPLVKVRAERWQKTTQPYRKKFPAFPTDPFDICNFTTREGLQVSWKFGNIAREKADILVNSATSNLNHPTMVGRALNLVGGPSFEAACSRHTNVQTGDIATTFGGNLACDYVIHAVCCDWEVSGAAEQTLRDLLCKILVVCNVHSARSVAMPLIGTGKHTFPEEVVLRVMKEEFERFGRMYRGTLKEIKLIRYGQGGIRKTDVSQAANDLTRSMSSVKPISTFVPLVAGSEGVSVRLEIFARSDDDIASAFLEVEKFIDSQITTKTIEHDKLAEIVAKHWDVLQRLATDNGLRVTCVNPTTVSIEGILDKVVEVKDKGSELVSRFLEEERRTKQLSYISENVQWYFTELGREMPYSSSANGLIEAAFMDGKATVEIHEHAQYEINFNQMYARNIENGQTRKLTRKMIGRGTDTPKEFALPSKWSPQREDQIFQLIQILPTTQEYFDVENHFVSRGGSAHHLYSVERVQNPRLYTAFSAVKKSMRGQGNEMLLFHPTNTANVDSINANNFSRSYSGVHGAVYGNGVYFNRDALYPIRYAERQYSGFVQKMYRAKVLVGDYTKGAPGMKAPPSKNDPNNPGVRYDSVVDNPSNPSKYVIWQDSQCYPEYLLTLQATTESTTWQTTSKSTTSKSSSKDKCTII